MEISSYIKELQNSVGKNDEIEKVLQNTSMLQEYLNQIGVKQEITRKPGFIYLIKKDMKQLLGRNTAVVTDKGIIASPKNFLKARQEDGSLDFLQYTLQDESFVKSLNYSFEAETGNVKCVEDTEVLKTTTIINKHGAIDKIIRTGRTPYFGDYSEEKRTIKNGIPVIISNHTGSSNFDRTSTYVDSGNPFSINDTSNEFDKNYQDYINDFPELEEWYQERFPGFKSNIKKYSDELSKSQLQMEIEELEKRIEIQKSTSRVINADVILLKEKLGMMLELLEEKGESNILIKPMIKQIFTEVESQNNGKLIPEAQEAKKEVPEEKKDETLEEKKIRLIAELERLREEDVNAGKYYTDLKSRIDSLRTQIASIPFVGTSLANKIHQEASTEISAIKEQTEQPNKEMERE